MPTQSTGLTSGTGGDFIHAIRRSGVPADRVVVILAGFHGDSRTAVLAAMDRNRLEVLDELEGVYRFSREIVIAQSCYDIDYERRGEAVVAAYLALLAAGYEGFLANTIHFDMDFDGGRQWTVQEGQPDLERLIMDVDAGVSRRPADPTGSAAQVAELEERIHARERAVRAANDRIDQLESSLTSHQQMVNSLRLRVRELMMCVAHLRSGDGNNESPTEIDIDALLDRAAEQIGDQPTNETF
jgi:uncharacterized coiled-coil protein SlyX